MTGEQFRAHGHAVIDWIADYWDRVGTLPVRAEVAPGEVRDSLPAHPPEHGETYDAVLADVDRLLLPGITHWQHPAFFGYFPANASYPAILGDLLSTGLGVQGMSWVTSPAATELEQVVLDWLAELLDLPAAWRSHGPGGGVIQDTASTATLTALVAALYRDSEGAASTAGVGSTATVYASREAHSSVDKAVRVAGVGTDRLRLVDVDPTTQAMDVAALTTLVEADVAAGLQPTFVVAALGTTSTGAIDPVRPIAEVCRQHGAWLHVDAAWAGVAAVCPEHRGVNDGLELVDSYATNPHKWLLTS